MASYYSGNKVQPEQVAHWLYQGGVRGDDLWKLTGIPKRESGYDVGAHRTDSPRERLSGDLGLFQINYSNVKQLQRAGVIGSRQDLFDPVKNTQAAVWLYKKGGLGPWAMGSNGWQAGGNPMKGVNTGEAQAAVSRYLANPQAYASGSAGPAQAAQPHEWDKELDVSVAAQSGAPATRDPNLPPTAEQQALTDMLSRYGVNYENAPEATPALLAFMRGLGMSLDTSEDIQRGNDLRIRQRSTMGREDLKRSDKRAKESLTTDAQRRGVLSSGEMNTRLARQAEDVAQSESRIAQTEAEALDKSQQTHQQISDQLGQTALERTLGVETSNATRAAVSQAQADSAAAQRAAADLSWKRQKDAQDAQRAQTQQFYANQGY